MKENDQVKEKANGWLVAVSILVPLVGLILFITMRESQPKTAKVSGICALVSFVLSIVLIPIILGILIFTSASSAIGNDALISKAQESKAKDEIATAREIVTLYVAEGYSQYISKSYTTNDTGDYSSYILKELKEAKEELKDKNVVLSASGDKVYISSDKYKVTGTVSDDGRITWSGIQEK